MNAKYRLILRYCTVFCAITTVVQALLLYTVLYDTMILLYLSDFQASKRILVVPTSAVAHPQSVDVAGTIVLYNAAWLLLALPPRMSKLYVFGFASALEMYGPR